MPFGRRPNACCCLLQLLLVDRLTVRVHPSLAPPPFFFFLFLYSIDYLQSAERNKSRSKQTDRQTDRQGRSRLFSSLFIRFLQSFNNERKSSIAKRERDQDHLLHWNDTHTDRERVDPAAAAAAATKVGRITIDRQLSLSVRRGTHCCCCCCCCSLKLFLYLFQVRTLPNQRLRVRECVLQLKRRRKSASNHFSSSATRQDLL